jgi:hypothetical protein
VCYNLFAPGVLIVLVLVCRILSGFQDRVIAEKARYAWKYGASRGVTGTPQFIVNGVHAPEVQDYDSADQWDQFITKLLSAPY